MFPVFFPVIDPVATGENIAHLRKERGYTVKQLQEYFGFEAPRAIYQWQKGTSLPSIDNLYALSSLFGVPMNDIIVPSQRQSNIIIMSEPQMEVCGSSVFLSGSSGKQQNSTYTSAIYACVMRMGASAKGKSTSPRSAEESRPKGHNILNQWLHLSGGQCIAK